MTILYDDTTNNYEAVRQDLFNEYAEQENWAVVDNVPDERVYEEIDCIHRMEREDLDCLFTEMFAGSHFIIMGTCGRWDGRVGCGTFIHSLNDLQRFISHLDTIKVYDFNGHLYIEGYHHDGWDCYELKRLTNKGYTFADSHYFAHDKWLHETIMHSNFYSALPRLAKNYLGVVA